MCVRRECPSVLLRPWMLRLGSPPPAMWLTGQQHVQNCAAPFAALAITIRDWMSI